MILGATRSRKELDVLGIDSDNIATITNEVLGVINERLSANSAAADMVKLRFESDFEKIQNKIDENKQLLKLKQSGQLTN